MSVSIATLGMFNPAIGSGTGVSAAGFITKTEDKKKPSIIIRGIKSKNISKNNIEITAVKVGD
jgi:hypothetical protein